MVKKFLAALTKSPHFIPLLLLFAVALFLRVYRLGAIPATFYVEEMTNTYVGRFIILHGRDIYGHILPLFYFDKFGDFPPVLPLYLSGLGTFVFGVTEFAGRFPIALVGALFIFPIYRLALLIFQDRRAAIFAGLIAATAPWHIVHSRTTAEGIVGLTVWAWGLLWILQGIVENDAKKIQKSFFLFFLTYFLYPGLRLITPLTLLPLPLFIGKTNPRLTKLLSLGIIGAFVLTGAIAMTPWGRARFGQTSLFSDPQIKAQIVARAQALSNTLGQNNVLEARIFHNKVVLYTREFIRQYLSYFSPAYLFYESGGQHRYFNVPDQGLLFIGLIPFLAAAVLLSKGKKTREPMITYFVYLLAITPISAALTTDFVPHTHRSLFMILPFILLATGGCVALLDGNRLKRVIIIAAIGFMALELIYFWHQYSIVATSYETTLRNDGDTQMVKYVLAHHNEYEAVYMSAYERLPLYYLFYSNNFRKDLIGAFKPGQAIDRADNVFFVEAQCPSTLVPADMMAKKILVVELPKCDGRPGLKGVMGISRHDGTAAYSIISTVPMK